MNRDYEEDEVGRSRARSRKKPSAKETREKNVSESSKRSSAGATARTGKAVGRDSGRKIYQESPAAGRAKARAEKSRKKRRIITMIIAECFALVFIFGYAFIARKASLLQRASDFKAEAVKSDLTIDALEKMQGYWTIALFGVDSRDSNVEKGTHSDVNMICNINEDTGEIKIVSVFRDSYLNVDDSGSYNKINLAYFRGGPTQAVKALNKNLDLDITDYVTFNWKAVAQGINILGGIDLELSKAEFKYINSFITETVKATGIPSKHLTHAGMNHLDGVQAVAYGRLRLMDTDYARTERQRKIIELAFEKAKKADIGTLNQIIEVVFPNISSSMTTADFIRMAQKIAKYHLGETGGFPFARGDANMGKKGACVIPQTLESNVTELHKFLFGDENYVPTDAVKKISAKISADSGMYNQGKSVGHVSTEGGIMTEPKKETTAAAIKEETKSTEEPEIVDDGIDLDGDGVADIHFNDEEFWDDPNNWPTDADGNPIHPSVKESSSAADGESESVKGSEASSEEGNSSTKATEATKHGGSSPTKATEATKPIKPTKGETETTKAHEKPSTAVPTSGGNDGPGGPESSENTSNGSGGPGGGSSSTDVVPPPSAGNGGGTNSGQTGSNGPGGSSDSDSSGTPGGPGGSPLSDGPA